MFLTYPDGDEKEKPEPGYRRRVGWISIGRAGSWDSGEPNDLDYASLPAIFIKIYYDAINTGNICFCSLANFPEQVVDNLPADVSTGIYYGWASVGSGDVHKMVVSIGWNPYYKNTKKSMVRVISRSVTGNGIMI